MNPAHYRAPAILAVVALLASVVMIALDSTLVPANSVPLRSDLRALSSTLLIVASVWVAAGSQRAWLRQHVDRRFEVVTVGLQQLGAEVAFVRESTGDIRPMVIQATARGTAPVRTNGHGLDPAVMEMGDRIARRLTDGA